MKKDEFDLADFKAMLDGKQQVGPSKKSVLEEKILDYLKDKARGKTSIYYNVAKDLGYDSDSHILKVCKKLAEQGKMAAVKGPNKNSMWVFSASPKFKDRFGVHDQAELLED